MLSYYLYLTSNDEFIGAVSVRKCETSAVLQNTQVQTAFIATLVVWLIERPCKICRQWMGRRAGAPGPVAHAAPLL
jgi:hypothetical protein